VVLPHTEVDGVALHYEVEGDGQPVLFIHGGFGGVESTLYPKRSVISGVLSPEAFRTITFDRRNSGRSGYDTRYTTLEELARDARGVLSAAGFERAIVLGDSLGGMVAQRFALDYPAATEGLVLLETSSHILRRTLQVKAILLAMRIVGPRALYRLFRRRFMEPDWSKPVGPDRSEDEVRQAREHDEEFRRRLRAMPDEELYRYSLGLIRTYVAFSGRDLRGELQNLHVPTHVLHGDADTIVSVRYGRELGQLIPNVVYTELPGLGHGLPYYEEGRVAMRSAVAAVAGALAKN
jgi:pimeloyl-ACP methyl ester carboxylesterase